MRLRALREKGDLASHGDVLSGVSISKAELFRHIRGGFGVKAAFADLHDDFWLIKDTFRSNVPGIQVLDPRFPELPGSAQR
jgi:hypothetical protein